MIIKRPHYLIIAILLVFAGSSAAQTPSATPRQEKLLNGLKVLYWNTPGVERTTLKLRIHAGSSFDPQDKEGVMKLLAESYFPTPETRSFFADELGGSFELVSNYDYIQFNAAARNGDFLTMLETVAQAISNPDLSKEATASLKAALSAKVQEAEKDGAYVADRSVAKRLFGTFPYGRSMIGTNESLQKIDFADLRFAKDRLFTADNATLVISGPVDPTLALRAVRRYFGAWLKSDKRVPSTFRQPDAPDSSVVKVEMAGVPNSEVRYAIRGVARSSKEFAAAEVLATVLNARMAELIAKNGGSNGAVTHDEHILPGAFVFRYRSQPASPVVIPVEGGSDASFRSMLSRPVTDAEFAAAKAAALAAAQKRDSADLWLDVDTFRIASVAEELRAFQSVSLTDVNSLASRLVREPLAAAVVAAPPAAATNTSN